MSEHLDRAFSPATLGRLQLKNRFIKPMVYFRGDSLATGMIKQHTNPIAKLGLKLICNKMFRDRVNCQMIYIGGCTEPASIEQVIKDGFDFVQLGRPLIKDPNYIYNLMQQRATTKMAVSIATAARPRLKSPVRLDQATLGYRAPTEAGTG